MIIQELGICNLYSRGIHCSSEFLRRSQNHPKLYLPTTLSHIALVSMLAPRREARRNDPLNFLTLDQYLLSERERLYIVGTYRFKL
jgi:hypothetical protein